MTSTPTQTFSPNTLPEVERLNKLANETGFPAAMISVINDNDRTVALTEFKRRVNGISLFKIVAAGNPSPAFANDGKYAHIPSADVKCEFFYNEQKEEIQEWPRHFSIDKKGNKSFRQRDRKGQINLTAGSVTFAMVPVTNKFGDGKGMCTATMTCNAIRFDFDITNPQPWLPTTNNVVPQVGDIVCAVVHYSRNKNTNPVVEKWCVCSNALMNLINLLKTGKYTTKSHGSGPIIQVELSSFYEVDNNFYQAQREIMSTFLSTANMSRVEVYLASLGITRDEHGHLDIFKQIDEETAVSRSEQLSGYCHVYQAIALFLFYGQLPCHANVPQSLGYQFWGNSFGGAKYWLLPKIIAEGESPTQSAIYGDDGTLLTDFTCSQSLRWINETLVAPFVTRDIVPFPVCVPQLQFNHTYPRDIPEDIRSFITSQNLTTPLDFCALPDNYVHPTFKEVTPSTSTSSATTTSTLATSPLSEQDFPRLS